MTVNDAWGAVAGLAASQHGVFHRSQAADLKLTNKRLAGLERRSMIRRIDRDLFAVTAAPACWHQGLIAANLIGLTISHRSAAELHRLDGFSTTGSEIVHASAPRQATHKRLELGDWSLTAHEIAGLTPRMITVVNKIQVTNVAVTLAMMGVALSHNHLEKALDSALRKGASERWISESNAALRRLGFQGTRFLDRVLDQPGRAGAVPDSWFERRLANTLRASGMPPLQLQYPVGRFRIDGAWPEVKLGLEAHSREFHFGRQAEFGDQNRDFVIASHGWELLYVTWRMLERPSELVERIRAVYETRQKIFGLSGGQD